MDFSAWTKAIVGLIAGAGISTILNYNTVSYKVDELVRELHKAELEIANNHKEITILDNRINSNRTFIRHNCRRLDTLEETTNLPVQDDCARPY